MSDTSDINANARAQRDAALAANHTAIAAILARSKSAGPDEQKAADLQVMALHAESLRIMSAFIQQIAADPANQAILAQLTTTTTAMTAVARTIGTATDWAGEATKVLGYGTQVIQLAGQFT